jgi:hypothetical protein
VTYSSVFSTETTIFSITSVTPAIMNITGSNQNSLNTGINTESKTVSQYSRWSSSALKNFSEDSFDSFSTKNLNLPTKFLTSVADSATIPEKFFSQSNKIPTTSSLMEAENQTKVASTTKLNQISSSEPESLSTNSRQTTEKIFTSTSNLKNFAANFSSTARNSEFLTSTPHLNNFTLNFSATARNSVSKKENFGTTKMNKIAITNDQTRINFENSENPTTSLSQTIKEAISAEKFSSPPKESQKMTDDLKIHERKSQKMTTLINLPTSTLKVIKQAKTQTTLINDDLKIEEKSQKMTTFINPSTARLKKVQIITTIDAIKTKIPTETSINIRFSLESSFNQFSNSASTKSANFKESAATPEGISDLSPTKENQAIFHFKFGDESTGKPPETNTISINSATSKKFLSDASVKTWSESITQSSGSNSRSSSNSRSNSDNKPIVNLTAAIGTNEGQKADNLSQTTSNNATNVNSTKSTPIMTKNNEPAIKINQGSTTEAEKVPNSSENLLDPSVIEQSKSTSLASLYKTISNQDQTKTTSLASNKSMSASKLNNASNSYSASTPKPAKNPMSSTERIIATTLQSLGCCWLIGTLSACIIICALTR